MAYSKFSSFRKAARMLTTSFFVGYNQGGDNFRIQYTDFIQQLNLAGGAGGGVPIYIDGTQLPSLDNEGNAVEKGDWAILEQGKTYSNINGGSEITAPAGRLSFTQFNGSTWELIDMGELPSVDTSGLATKAEFQTVAPVAEMFVYSNNLLDNSTFKFGRWNEDGTTTFTNNELRSELIPIDDSKENLTFSGGTAYSNAGARFVFKNDEGELLGFSDNNTDSIPAGTTQVGVTIAYNTSMGSDPTNTIYKNTAMLNYGTVALPFETYSVKIGAEFIAGLTSSHISDFDSRVEQVANEAVSSQIDPINEKLNFLMSGYEKHTEFNGVDGEVIIDQFVLNNTGDYIEWISKPANDAIPNQSYGLFGTRAISQSNVLGYWQLSSGEITEIALRQSVPSGTATWIRFDGLGDLKNDFHKFKLVVNGSNWELYVDDVLKGTKPKDNPLVINNIGYAYAAAFAKFSLKSVRIHTSTQDFQSDSVETLSGATSGVTAKYTNLNPEAEELSPFYVSYETTGTDAAGGALFGKFIVYCKREGYENSYSGIEVWHEVDMSEEVWKDYWRIGFAEEYRLDGGQMIRTHQKVLATGESESVWKRQNTPNSKADFTGGWHGDEVMRSNGFKLLIDGIIADLSTNFNLVAARSVEYSIMSDMTEVADLIEGVTTPIAGHPIDCSHFKRTTFKIGGYKTYNKMVWARPVPVMLWDFGICCFGKVQGIQGFNDSVESATFNNKDNTYHLTKTGGNRVDYQNPTTGLSGYVTSTMIRPTNKESLSILRVQDRFYDSKYYNMYQENVTTSAGEIWESEMEVTFK